MRLQWPNRVFCCWKKKGFCELNWMREARTEIFDNEAWGLWKRDWIWIGINEKTSVLKSYVLPTEYFSIFSPLTLYPQPPFSKPINAHSYPHSYPHTIPPHSPRSSILLLLIHSFIHIPHPIPPHISIPPFPLSLTQLQPTSVVRAIQPTPSPPPSHPARKFPFQEKSAIISRRATVCSFWDYVDVMWYVWYLGGGEGVWARERERTGLRRERERMRMRRRGRAEEGREKTTRKGMAREGKKDGERMRRKEMRFMSGEKGSED